MKKFKSIFPVVLFLVSASAFADGSEGCLDGGVKFICQCVENSKTVEFSYSSCIDQTSRNYRRSRNAYAQSCEQKSTEDKDCRVFGTAK